MQSARSHLLPKWTVTRIVHDITINVYVAFLIPSPALLSMVSA